MTSPRGLRSIGLKTIYTTGREDLSRSFFIPLLTHSKTYDRGVGYFTSGWIRKNAAGLAHFAMNGGRARWVTSPILSPNDLIALSNVNSLSDSPEVLENLFATVDELRDALEADTLNTMAWMVADGLMEFRFAIPTAELDGDFHDKFGIFGDDAGQRVSFLGSYNDTMKGHRNYESIHVFFSWDENSLDSVNEFEQRFARIWLDNEANLKVFSLPEAVRARILKYQTDERPYPEPDVPDIQPAGLPLKDAPEQQNRWRHQDEAIEHFLRAERGVLDMATGTGKTRTALGIVRTLIEQNQIETVIISTHGTDLLSQWYSEILKALRDFDNQLLIYRHYSDYREREKFSLERQDAILLASRGALPAALRTLPPEIAQRTLLIHDEVHGLGSPSNRKELQGLSDSIRFRLGLSATPDREYDEEGNEFIENHIGPVLFNFGLDEAIERGILAPFNYYPLSYETTDEDREKIRSIHATQAARKKHGNPMSNEEVWTRISQVYKCSPAKLPVFRQFIDSHQHLLERCIVFVETQEYAKDVLEIIHRYRPDFHTYFSGEDSHTLKRFAAGDLECLIACHRLSEGIDIQSLNNVILFSSARARLETIQRIGRCLRTNPANPDKVANIVDFIRDNDNDTLNADEEREVWLTQLSALRALE